MNPPSPVSKKDFSSILGNLKSFWLHVETGGLKRYYVDLRKEIQVIREKRKSIEGWVDEVRGTCFHKKKTSALNWAYIRKVSVHKSENC